MLAEIPLILGTAGWATAATTAACLYRRRLHTDALTGLGNRASLYHATRSKGTGRSLGGLLMIDLDQFKAINDTHGHDFGNKVLAAVAAQLAKTTQPWERAIRLHGDEFAVWLGRVTSTAEAERRAEQFTAALAEPIWVDGHRLTTLRSVGLSVGPNNTPLNDLLGQADAHMYEIKANRRLTVLPTRSDRTRDAARTPGGEAA